LVAGYLFRGCRILGPGDILTEEVLSNFGFSEEELTRWVSPSIRHLFWGRFHRVETVWERGDSHPQERTTYFLRH
jgi:hypothetical protein